MPTTLRSFSKINLGLAIGPARPDGFHALTTLYQTLAAHDLVTVEARPAATNRIAITSNDQRVPLDGRNTAHKIAERALGIWGGAADVTIHIDKRLPVQGGVGAGSANAAAALLGLERELTAHGVRPLTAAERLGIAAQVGSDVPLFLVGGAVLGRGRGEDVVPMPDLPPINCLLALPGIGVSTPQAFRDWDARHASSATPSPTASFPASSSLTAPPASDRLGELSRTLASLFGEPHSSGVFAAGEGLAGNSGSEANSFAGRKKSLLALVQTGIENDFEEVVFPQNPLFGQIKRALCGPDSQDLNAALYAALSGSGSALFGLYATDDAAAAAESRLDEMGVRWLRTETLSRDAYWRQMLVK